MIQAELINMHWNYNPGYTIIILVTSAISIFITKYIILVKELFIEFKGVELL
jgi:hypothetical protein